MFQMNEIIDFDIFIVRHKFTFKQGLETAPEEVSKLYLKGFGIIVYNIKPDKSNLDFLLAMNTFMVIIKD